VETQKLDLEIKNLREENLREKLEIKKLKKENDALKKGNAELMETIKTLGQDLYPTLSNFTKSYQPPENPQTSQFDKRECK
jgi:hypothetical protein